MADDIDAAAKPEFVHGPSLEGFDGFDAEVELGGNFLVGIAQSGTFDHFCFASAQNVDAGLVGGVGLGFVDEF